MKKEQENLYLHADGDSFFVACELAVLQKEFQGEPILDVESDIDPRDLFGKQGKALRKVAIEEAADKIREKYGNRSIIRAVSLRKK